MVSTHHASWRTVVFGWAISMLLTVQVDAQSQSDFGQFDRLSPQTQQPVGNIAQPRIAAGAVLELTRCGAHLIDDIEIPALVSGQLDQLAVIRGAKVGNGQLMAKIDDKLSQYAVEESQFRLELANFQATDETPVQAADKEIQLRKTQFDRIADLYAKRSTSEFDYLERQFQHQIAELKQINAVNQMKVADFESKVEQAKLKVAKDQLDRHTILAPFDGHVFEIIKHRGEWVNAGEPVFRLARMDRVRIKGWVAASEYDPQELTGRRVTVLIPMARGRQVELEGNVVFVGMERVDKNFELLAEVKNQEENGSWVISASHTDITMRIHLQD